MTTIKSKFPRSYSCEEVQERMENGLCLFCDEPDIAGHQLKHRRSQIFMIELDDDQICAEKELDFVASHRKEDHAKSIAEEKLNLPLRQNIEHLVSKENQHTPIVPRFSVSASGPQSPPLRPPDPPDLFIATVAKEAVFVGSLESSSDFQFSVIQNRKLEAEEEIYLTNSESIPLENNNDELFPNSNSLLQVFVSLDQEDELSGVTEVISTDMIPSEESNPEKESRPEVSQQMETFPCHQVQYPRSSIGHPISSKTSKNCAKAALGYQHHSAPQIYEIYSSEAHVIGLTNSVLVASDCVYIQDLLLQFPLAKTRQEFSERPEVGVYVEDVKTLVMKEDEQPLDTTGHAYLSVKISASLRLVDGDVLRVNAADRMRELLSQFQVTDMLQLVRRPLNNRRQNTSPKTWWFKFKHKIMRRENFFINEGKRSHKQLCLKIYGSFIHGLLQRGEFQEKLDNKNLEKQLEKVLETCKKMEEESCELVFEILLYGFWNSWEGDNLSRISKRESENIVLLFLRNLRSDQRGNEIAKLHQKLCKSGKFKLRKPSNSEGCCSVDTEMEKLSTSAKNIGVISLLEENISDIFKLSEQSQEAEDRVKEHHKDLGSIKAVSDQTNARKEVAEGKVAALGCSLPKFESRAALPYDDVDNSDRQSAKKAMLRAASYELDIPLFDTLFDVLAAQDKEILGDLISYAAYEASEKLPKSWKFKFKGKYAKNESPGNKFSFAEKPMVNYANAGDYDHQLFGTLFLRVHGKEPQWKYHETGKLKHEQESLLRVSPQVEQHTLTGKRTIKCKMKWICKSRSMKPLTQAVMKSYRKHKWWSKEVLENANQFDFEDIELQFGELEAELTQTNDNTDRWYFLQNNAWMLIPVGVGLQESKWCSWSFNEKSWNVGDAECTWLLDKADGLNKDFGLWELSHLQGICYGIISHKLFLMRESSKYEQLTNATSGIKSASIICQVANFFTDLGVYRVFHLLRPPEFRRAKRYGQTIYQVFSLSSLRTRMFSTREYCDRISSLIRFIVNHRFTYFIYVFRFICSVYKTLYVWLWPL